MLRLLTSITFLLILVYSSGCTADNSNTLFTSVNNSTTGINFRNTLFEDGPLNITNYIYFYNGAGVATGDINNDGLVDILFTGNMVKNRLFINKGNFKFEDITAQSGIAEKQGWCTGASMVDINGDGKLDIYICRSADKNPEMRKNLLFINTGNLTFTEKAAEYGLDDIGYSTQAAFFDYDKDGDLDCFINNHSVQKYTAGVQDDPAIRNERNPIYASKLYRNDNGHYTDVSLAAGITSNVLTFGLGIAVSDINNDGWPDVYVSNDFNEQDYFFINNKNGTFSDQLAKRMNEVSLYSMGNDAADYDNDGLVDLITLDMLPEDNKTQKMHSGAENFDKFQLLFGKGYYYQYSRNMLQKNNGDGTFSEVGQLANVSGTDWSWASLFSDYDNDGYKDLFVTNGYVKDNTEMDFVKYTVDRMVKEMHHDSVDGIKEYISKMPSIQMPNYIFQNNGAGIFEKKTKEWGIDQPGVSAGAAYADLDNDGDMDLVVSNTNDFAGIYKNNSNVQTKNNFIKIKLQGDAKNGSGIGTKITLYSGNNKYYQEQFPVRGFQSSVDPVLNFGIGNATMIDSAVVIWPNDKMQKLAGIKAGQVLTIKQQDASVVYKYDTAATGIKYLSPSAGLNFTHKENNFNDFTVQSLLPHYLSRQGPCIAKADINNDKREDVFIGGAKGQASQIFIQQADGNFINKPQPLFVKDLISEDVAADFFDADGDGDMDLYVGTGGYEFTENDAALQDRLYMNDGTGNFAKSDKALPQLFISTGTVKAADIDGDGDIDIFVGGRLVPGKYPTTPESKILLNDGKGIFTDATNSVAPAVAKVGMVTDALWMDLNKDNTPDLIVVGEWMSVKVFINAKGKLTDASASYIHFASTGWWNRIRAADMDGDGDMDLVIGNCGTNTQFHVNEKEPMNLYYKDFDNNGSIDPILCYYIGGVSYPAASLDDLTEQLPFLKKKFLAYKEYANATLQDIFTPDQLKDTGFLKAETMETIYLENEGSKGFTKKELPLPAQYAPVYSIVIADFNGDGKKDILLAGNNTWTRIKFGRYSANHGVVLAGDGKGNFKYVPQQVSGLKLRENIRSAALLSDHKILLGVNDGNALLLNF